MSFEQVSDLVKTTKPKIKDSKTKLIMVLSVFHALLLAFSVVIYLLICQYSVVMEAHQDVFTEVFRLLCPLLINVIYGKGSNCLVMCVEKHACKQLLIYTQFKSDMPVCKVIHPLFWISAHCLLSNQTEENWVLFTTCHIKMFDISCWTK